MSIAGARNYADPVFDFWDTFCQFLAPQIIKIIDQFLGPETKNIVSFWPQLLFPEFLPIEKEKNNWNIFWITYDFHRKKKNPFEQKLGNFIVFRAHKLSECVSFWARILTLWVRDTISLDLISYSRWSNMYCTILILCLDIRLLLFPEEGPL